MFDDCKTRLQFEVSSFFPVDTCLYLWTSLNYQLLYAGEVATESSDVGKQAYGWSYHSVK